MTERRESSLNRKELARTVIKLYIKANEKKREKKT